MESNNFNLRHGCKHVSVNVLLCFNVRNIFHSMNKSVQGKQLLLEDEGENLKLSELFENMFQ